MKSFRNTTEEMKRCKYFKQGSKAWISKELVLMKKQLSSQSSHANELCFTDDNKGFLWMPNKDKTGETMNNNKNWNLLEIKGIVNKYAYAVLGAIITYVLFAFSKAWNIKS